MSGIIKLGELQSLERESEPAPWDTRTAPGMVTNTEYDIARFDNPQDAAGICAMRNAYPVLLRIARAALEAADAYRSYQGEVIGELYANRCTETMETLITQLKAVRP